MPSYQETVEWIFKQLPFYQNVGASAYKANLDNTHRLMAHLNHPETKFKSIHVGGTNGKGSTSSLLASIFSEAGYKVGLFTSPHLKDYRERIRINGEMISEEAVVNFIETNQSFFKTHSLSFFEMTVGLAFDYFVNESVDIAIIEVGLGGRLDSTNVIMPELSVITNIGLDHTSILGETHEKIAYEKAGIIKKNSPVVIGEFRQDTFQVFKNIAQKQNATLHKAFELEDVVLESPLIGNYQKHNFKTALKTIDLINQMGNFHVPESCIKQGFKNVIKNTGLMGRWQILQQKPMIVCDTAHNFEGLKAVLAQINNHEFEDLHMVLGFVNDKNLDEIINILPSKAIYYIAKPDVVRGLKVEILKDLLIKKHLTVNCYKSVSQAFEAAKKQIKTNDFLYVGGSTFVVAEII